MTYLLNLLIALDQFGNALLGGNPDASISGRVGFHAVHHTSRYWLRLERLINWTFHPLDGPSHCYDAMLRDDEDYHPAGPLVRTILGGGALLLCPLLALLVRFLALFLR